jgi:hypothetical protein
MITQAIESILRAERCSTIVAIDCEGMEGVTHLRGTIHADQLPSTIDACVLNGEATDLLRTFWTVLPRCTRLLGCTHTTDPQCVRIRTILETHPDWKEVLVIPFENGFSLFRSISSINEGNRRRDRA